MKRSTSTKRPKVRPEPTPPPKETHELKLTVSELIHLRDLMSVLLPIEMSDTLSLRLAQSTGRELVEPLLWQKVVKACIAANIATDEEAPDFVVAVSSIPAISVFEVGADQPTASPEEALQNVFARSNDDEPGGEKTP